MMIPPKNGQDAAETPSPELSRLEKLRKYLILDSGPETAYDDITRLICRELGVPMAMITLVDEDRHWFKSRVGMEASETARSVAFCEHAAAEPDKVFVVQDARLDSRFQTNPLVTSGPFIRFYAGAPIVSPEGLVMGTVCALDTEPRVISAEHLARLSAIAADVIALLEARLIVKP